MQGDGPSRGALASVPDGALWRRACTIDTDEDVGERLLDLAAYADGMLDPDDRERVAEWVERDPSIAGDIAAARELAAAAARIAPAPEAILAPARALVGGAEPGTARIFSFTPRPRWRTGVRDLAQWASLAAAVVIASWLGFSLGMDASRSFGLASRDGDDFGLSELFDPSTSLLRDLADGA